VTFVPLGEANGRDAWVVRADDGRSFAVFALEDGPRVTDAVCPHNQGPLEQGWVRDGQIVVCPWHWYRFDVDTGACETTSQYELGTYPVREHDGVLVADVGDPPRALSWSERLRAHSHGDG
jgi:nitrite reductase/ring-hydroxylating ferredoxin subunit